MTDKVTASQIVQWRLANQSIGPHRPTTTIADLTHHLLALQAQDFNQALWALGSRCAGTTRIDVDAALNNGSVVRSWPMRGTLHFLRPDDLRIILSLTSQRSLASIAERRNDLGLDPATLDRARQVTVAHLRGGGSLGRSEFTAALEEAGIDTAAQRGPHLIGHLAQTGVVCWGPRHGSAQALVLLDEWAPRTIELNEDEALRQLVTRYFTGHGPATLKDLIWWSKVTVAQAKRGLELARQELTELQLNGASYWIETAALQALPRTARPAAGVQLLPGFDEYLLGYQDRSLVLPAEHAQQIVPGNNGIFLPMIVSSGQIIGTWRRETRPTEVRITPIPFRPLLTRETKAMQRAAREYGSFLGLPATVQAI